MSMASSVADNYKPLRRSDNVDVARLLTKEVENKYGKTVPESAVVKMFGHSHGLPIINGVVAAVAVGGKLNEARNLALESVG